MAKTDANPPMPEFATDYVLQEVDPTFLTAAVKKRLEIPVISEKGEDGVRRYYVAPLAG